jgi:hypothetical protein
MQEILNELDVDDQEHPDCWLTDEETGWTLSIFQGGLVIWDHFGDGDTARHMVDVPRRKALELWLTLATGTIEKIESEPWQPGSHPPLDPEELRRRQEEIEQFTREQDRQYYNSLGPERPNTQCRVDGCQRGTVQFSVFCKRHDFERTVGRPCPFTH